MAPAVLFRATSFAAHAGILRFNSFQKASCGIPRPSRNRWRATSNMDCSFGEWPMSNRSSSSSLPEFNNTATGLPFLVTTTGSFFAARMTPQDWQRLYFGSQLSYFHLLSGHQEPVTFLDTYRLDLDFTAFVIDPIKYAEAIIRSKANFPGCFKRRRLPQWFAVPRFLAGSCCNCYSMVVRMWEWCFASMARRCFLVA